MSFRCSKTGTKFKTTTLKDGGNDVFELMQINDGVDAAKKEGYKLLKKSTERLRSTDDA